VFSGFIVSSYVLSFVFVVLFLAFDFWVVKNISGRLLVGLKWWNEVLEDGSSKWNFDSVKVLINLFTITVYHNMGFVSFV
jgi:hypothetical protein